MWQRLFLLLACVFGGLLLVVVMVLALVDFKADPSSKSEMLVMNWVKHAILIRGKSEGNPLNDTPAEVADGREAFSHYCVVCHGKDGQNTGVPFADRMSPSVPSLAGKEVQSYSDGQLKWIIDYGIWPSGMPGSKNMLSDEEIWSIVLYIRHLPPAGSLGEPEMYTH
jgi:cytochrome c